MNDSDKMKDDSLEKALSMMEHPEEWTEDELLEIMEDEECMQVCQDILDCRLAMQQEHLSLKPDVEAEWEKIRQKHSRRSNRYWVTMGVAIGMAASFLLMACSKATTPTLNTTPHNRRSTKPLPK